jgi:hypothetical protein
MHLENPSSNRKLINFKDLIKKIFTHKILMKAPLNFFFKATARVVAGSIAQSLQQK